MSTCWINNVVSRVLRARPAPRVWRADTTLLLWQGEVVAHRRKIMPTGAERVIFGNASGDTINNVIDSPFGRLGSLQCWCVCSWVQPRTLMVGD